jgi:acyl-homoserine lactone acylase PvdQ
LAVADAIDLSRGCAEAPLAFGWHSTYRPEPTTWTDERLDDVVAAHEARMDRMDQRFDRMSDQMNAGFHGLRPDMFLGLLTIYATLLPLIGLLAVKVL